MKMRQFGRGHDLCRRAVRPVVESLENRQLLTAVIDLRLPGGGKTANVSSVGQTVNIDVWAVVTGANSSGADDGFQDLSASFISTHLTTTSVKGDLSAANVAPFNATGADPGTQADLNGDGSLDVGGTDPTLATGWFFARAGSMQTTGGVIAGASQSFKIGSLSFKTTALGSGETDVNFVPRDPRTSAVWREDGLNTRAGLLSAGTPIKITTGTTPPPPPPVTGAISGTVYKDLNGDGIKQAGETPLAGVTVYIDANKNGIKDATEKSLVTGTAGTYNFTSLAAGTYRVREVVPTTAKLIAPAAGFYDVTVAAAAVTGKNFFDQPKTAAVITIDNTKATVVGSWTSKTSPAGFVGTNYLTDGNTGKGQKSVTFKTAVPTTGQYLVYARWVAGTDRSTSVPIDIHSQTSTVTTVKVNQQLNGGSWVLLGTYTFDTTHGATITLRNGGTTGTVIADAIELVKVV
jgi:hypothetical protein